MKHLYKLCLALILPLIIFNCKTRKLAQPTPTATIPLKAPANFRVVGYMVGGEIAKGQAHNFDLTKLTYLNVFLSSPGADGKFKTIPHLDSMIMAAHNNHVKVIATLGNGINLSLLADTNRANFIDSLVSSAVAMQLDGIDIDLEGDQINKDYEGFVGDLSVALKAN